MRVVIFFDLPVTTARQRRAYRDFRKNLLEEGFLMIQESVYIRITTNRVSAIALEKRIAEIVPSEGVVQSLLVTEKQYASMRFLSGTPVDDIRNSDERTIFL
ncbi:CRISPR-associated endonuclease Cas2 [Bifidobacterium choloepi]|uniref:CRISPR-associated endoribonuclease Cas2 n=1 Tax=Bifidobacterium choloepi TaxID=2614131 RepID=A0A6I5N601_9BIFI|nr:CRISPR-associated endonuclease Cas2 [Bifidobacterium choloepi]NEG69211.1 CRISPR-associated endonuclease Cas2 [Bifidobacterium choloepi]